MLWQCHSKKKNNQLKSRFSLFPTMETAISLKIFISLAAVLLSFPPGFSSLPVADRRISAGAKYQIECTMCSACDNPCGQYLSPPPPPPSPPPPVNCPPPPSPPSSGTYYYYSPPPPAQPTYTYSSPPPPRGIIGPGGYYQPPPYNNYPAPPPPNPIVPYFPFYYHTPPPGSSAAVGRLTNSLACSVLTVALFSFLLALF